MKKGSSVPRYALAAAFALTLPLATVVRAQSNAELLDATRSPGEVLINGMTYDAQRFSRLNQINRSNVKALVPVWNVSLNNNLGEESQPLVYNGAIYITNQRATYAIDARTGRVRWTDVLEFDSDVARVVCCGQVNRGAAIYDDKLFRGTLDAHVMAIDIRTGKQVWKTDADGFGGCWSSPILVDLADGKQELVVSVPHEIWGLDPATGDFLWFSEGVKEGPMCPTLVSQNGIVYAIGGRQGGAVAVRAGGRDDVTKTHIVWRKSFGSYVTSPVLLGDYLYWVSDRGIAYCAKCSDGEQVYQQRLADAGQLYASVVVANGSLFAVSRENGTFVYAAKPQLESVARNSLDEDAGTCNATPAFSDGRMFLRSNRYLYCIGRK